MDFREAEGLELAARAKITWDGEAWSVPSQSGKGRYRVLTWPGAESCTCEDWQLRQRAPFCKHLLAAKLVEEREGKRDAPPIDTDTLPKKPKYRQVWPAYNRAQGIEKERFRELLYDLCKSVENVPWLTPGKGREPHTRRDMIFAMTYQVYTLFSGRRFGTDLRELHRDSYLTRLISGMKVCQFFKKAELVPILKELVAISAMPLRTVEDTFAIDSSGFGTLLFERWYDEKYGVPSKRNLWIKVHLSCGTKTNIVTAVRIFDKDSADSPQLPPLVKETAKRFSIGEVSADKAYGSLENFEAVADCGGQAFIAFKSNTTGAVGGLFAKMFHFFQYKQDEYLAHYHRRSAVESTFSMIKRKFGNSVRSKTDTSMKAEILCKILAHNLCCLIQEEQELGIQSDFRSEHKKSPPPTLQLVTA